jgi:hypothetical protein
VVKVELGIRARAVHVELQESSRHGRLGKLGGQNSDQSLALAREELQKRLAAVGNPQHSPGRPVKSATILAISV